MNIRLIPDASDEFVVRGEDCLVDGVGVAAQLSTSAALDRTGAEQRLTRRRVIGITAKSNSARLNIEHCIM